MGYVVHFFVVLIPPSLYGMLILAAGLHFNIFNAEKMETSITWIIRNMGVCFVPAGVGIMNYFDLIKASGVQVLIFTIATTIVLMVLVGWSYQKLFKELQGE